MDLIVLQYPNSDRFLIIDFNKIRYMFHSDKRIELHFAKDDFLTIDGPEMIRVFRAFLKDKIKQ